jgi:hypothetical protein
MIRLDEWAEAGLVTTPLPLVWATGNLRFNQQYRPLSEDNTKSG